MRSGEPVHVSGQFAFDAAGEFPDGYDFGAQLRRAHAHMDRVLDHYGATRNQIVSQTLYVVDLRHHAAAAARANPAYFGEHRPAGTVLGVTEPTVPGQVVEIAFVIEARLPA
ncbi:RidA family protein [Streptomyces coelicoflavus]|uniref:RidA family protein n=1 Tax=Streptomyces coelicoflavus TaxID=285562 RepID=A0A7K3PWR4_9ACTN|nr:RidA family protein [Streptomyces coelicoflavus]